MSPREQYVKKNPKILYCWAFVQQKEAFRAQTDGSEANDTVNNVASGGGVGI